MLGLEIEPGPLLVIVSWFLAETNLLLKPVVTELLLPFIFPICYLRLIVVLFTTIALTSLTFLFELDVIDNLSFYELAELGLNSGF